jgi:hypothetical protein
MMMEKIGGSPVSSATLQSWSPVAGGQLSLVRLKKNSKLWREREREKSFVVKGDAMRKAPNPRPLASVLASALAPAPPSLMIMIIIMAGPCGAGQVFHSRNLRDHAADGMRKKKGCEMSG